MASSRDRRTSAPTSTDGRARCLIESPRRHKGRNIEIDSVDQFRRIPRRNSAVASRRGTESPLPSIAVGPGDFVRKLDRRFSHGGGHRVPRRCKSSPKRTSPLRDDRIPRRFDHVLRIFWRAVRALATRSVGSRRDGSLIARVGCSGHNCCRIRFGDVVERRMKWGPDNELPRASTVRMRCGGPAGRVEVTQ